MSVKALAKEQEDTNLNSAHNNAESAVTENGNNLDNAQQAPELQNLNDKQNLSTSEHQIFNNSSSNTPSDSAKESSSIAHVIASNTLSSDKAAANETTVNSNSSKVEAHTENIKPYVFKPTYKEEKTKLDPFSALLIRALGGGYGDAHYGTSTANQDDEDKPSQEALALRATYKNSDEKLDNPSLMQRVKSGFVSDEQDLYARNHVSYASNRRDHEKHAFASSVATVVSALEAKNLQNQEQVLSHHDQYSKAATEQASYFSQRANQALQEMNPHHHNIGSKISKQYEKYQAVSDENGKQEHHEALQQAYAQGYAAALKEQKQKIKAQDKAEFERAYKEDSLTSITGEAYYNQDAVTYDEYDDNYLYANKIDKNSSLFAQAALNSSNNVQQNSNASAEYADLSLKAHLLCTLGWRMAQCGAETRLIIQSVKTMARDLGCNSIDLSLTREGIVVKIRHNHHVCVEFKEIKHFAINMDSLARLHKVCLRVSSGELTDPKKVLIAIRAVRPRHYNHSALIYIEALAGACFAYLNGGTLAVCLSALIGGVFLMYTRFSVLRRGFFEAIAFMLSAFIGSFVACLISTYIFHASDSENILASTATTLLLVPGFPIINGFLDVFKGYIPVGMTRLVTASVLIIAAAVGLLATFYIMTAITAIFPPM